MASDILDICIKKRRIDHGGRSCCSRTTGSLESLPREIIADIFSRLPITSLVQLRFVCRSWRLLTRDSILLSTHLSSSSSYCLRNPCLLLHRDLPIRNELHFLDLSSYGSSKEDQRLTPKTKKFSLRFSASMPEFEVVGSSNGLLCLTDSLYNDPVYVYNPFTRDSTKLPESSTRYNDQELVFGFGFHPRTKEFKVVKIVYYRSNSSSRSSSRSRARSRVQFKQSEVQILTLKDNIGSLCWRSLGKAPYKFMKISSEAVVNGRLHFVTHPRRYVSAGKFVSFDLADEEFREIPKPDLGGLNRSNNTLVNLKGCLCAIVHGNYGKLDIWVMKTYEVKESWTKEYSIGAYVPKRLKQSSDRPILLRRNAEKGKVVRVLCVLENGEILLEYKNRVLVAYDPKKGKFNDLVFDRLPNWFHTVVHVGTLGWFDTQFDV